MPKRKWNCWILSSDDIFHIAERNGIKPYRLKGKLDDIARRFQKGIDWSLEDWDFILEEAISLNVSKSEKDKKK